MNQLTRYRELQAALNAAAVRVHSLTPGAARTIALYDFQQLHKEAADLIAAASAALGLLTETQFPKHGTLQEQMLALPYAARQAYNAKLRLDVAESDFAVHLLTWADTIHADDAPRHSCSLPESNTRKEGLPANDTHR